MVQLAHDIFHLMRELTDREKNDSCLKLLPMAGDYPNMIVLKPFCISMKFRCFYLQIDLISVSLKVLSHAQEDGTGHSRERKLAII